MASEKNVIVRGSEEENLHTMMEVLEGISARTKELGDVGSDVDELKGAICNGLYGCIDHMAIL